MTPASEEPGAAQDDPAGAAADPAGAAADPAGAAQDDPAGAAADPAGAAQDPAGAAGAGGGGFQKLEEREIHAGRVVRLTESVFSTPGGGRMTRDVVHHRGAVAVVAVDGDELVLLRQYRSPVEGELLEIPAGTRDVDGEDPAGTARRELAEEAGLACDSLEELGTFFTSPGFCDELSHLFLATGLHPVPRQPDGAEEEWMTIQRVSLDEAAAMIDRGEIRDAKTIIGVLLARRRLRR